VLRHIHSTAAAVPELHVTPSELEPTFQHIRGRRFEASHDFGSSTTTLLRHTCCYPHTAMPHMVSRRCAGSDGTRCVVLVYDDRRFQLCFVRQLGAIEADLFRGYTVSPPGRTGLAPRSVGPLAARVAPHWRTPGAPALETGAAGRSRCAAADRLASSERSWLQVLDCRLWQC
jgi:hypothetical protein